MTHVLLAAFASSYSASVASAACAHVSQRRGPGALWVGEGGGLHAAYERAKRVGVTDDQHRLPPFDERGSELLVP